MPIASWLRGHKNGRATGCSSRLRTSASIFSDFAVVDRKFMDAGYPFAHIATFLVDQVSGDVSVLRVVKVRLDCLDGTDH